MVSPSPPAASSSDHRSGNEAPADLVAAVAPSVAVGAAPAGPGDAAAAAGVAAICSATSTSRIEAPVRSRPAHSLESRPRTPWNPFRALPGIPSAHGHLRSHSCVPSVRSAPMRLENNVAVSAEGLDDSLRNRPAHPRSTEIDRVRRNKCLRVGQQYVGQGFSLLSTTRPSI